MTRTSNLVVKRIPVLVLALPLACVFDKQLDPQESGDSSGANESSSTSDDGDATTSEDPGDPLPTTDDSMSTSPPGDDSGTDSTTGGDANACESEQATLSTEFDGEQIGVLWDTLAMFVDEMGLGVEFGVNGRGGDGWPGMLIVRASNEQLAMPGPVQAGGYLREPLESPSRPAAWYCFDDTSTLVDDGAAVTVSLEGLQLFGACPGGEPQLGTIAVCFGDASCGGESTVDVALTDAAYLTALSDNASKDIGIGELLTKRTVGSGPSGTSGMLGIHATNHLVGAPGERTSPLGEVFFIAPLGAPDGGAIYCAGEGSTLTYDGASGDPISASLTNVTRLGSCADEGGSVGVGHFCADFG